MTTAADIVNRAAQLIGGFNNQGPVTGSPPNFDGTALGIAAGVLYNSVVQTVARQFGWDFSRNSATLVNTTGTPPIGLTYEYYYPTNGIQVRQLTPATIPDVNDPRPYSWVVGNTVAGLTPATGTIFFPSNPINGDTITLNGVPFMFVSGTPGPDQVQIGATAGLTGLALISVLDASSDPAVTVAAYSGSGGPDTWTLHVTYKTFGPQGNSYTLAASAATPSGATLTGGTSAQRKVIWTDIADAVALFTNQPGEDTWDALFTETVVRLLASELATALPGKPETAKITLEQSAAFEKAGETRLES